MQISSDSNGAAACQVWRVLIVDDHPIFRDGLRELLRQEPGFVVAGEAESEEGAFQLFNDTNPDLVTVDVSLASGNGLNLIARMKTQRHSVTILAISMYEDKVYAELALAAGASGYLCKHSECNQVKTAIASVLRGEVYVTPGLLQNRLPQSIVENPARASKEKQLSSRELQIFTMIGQGRSTHEIAAELHIAVSTVETYRERLKAKLNLASGAELTRHAIFWTVHTT